MGAEMIYEAERFLLEAKRNHRQAQNKNVVTSEGVLVVRDNQVTRLSRCCESEVAYIVGGPCCDACGNLLGYEYGDSALVILEGDVERFLSNFLPRHEVGQVVKEVLR